ncbi:hypothetical protein ABZ368_11515 [Streptomyces sp. NPDC005908]|uniref:hypothetical protein n=1 Tax=unclassified Streptomyces TaxID=2593676 RepID=UPI0011A35BE0|nr:hypothetical protein [Streptomyces sp. T12]TWD20483.1 hypothetical protein FB570_107288 [Streptomyces sp. T12]
MITVKKIVAVAAGILGSFALIGAGAVQAVSVENTAMCADDGKGNVRCTQEEYRVTNDQYGNLRIVNRTTQNCTGSNGSMSCVSSLTVPGEKS